MGAERSQIPDWAQQERESELAWINENLPIFELAAAVAYEDSGRGAIVADTTAKLRPGLGFPFGYLTQEQIDEHGDEDTQRMVREYDPEEQFVIVLCIKYVRLL
jgi:hypothetical protein